MSDEFRLGHSNGLTNMRIFLYPYNFPYSTCPTLSDLFDYCPTCPTLSGSCPTCQKYPDQLKQVGPNIERLDGCPVQLVRLKSDSDTNSFLVYIF